MDGWNTILETNYEFLSDYIIITTVVQKEAENSPSSIQLNGTADLDNETADNEFVSDK